MKARIEALDPPFEAEVAAQLERMMPGGRDPIGLFRTFFCNLPMARAMGGWGSYELGSSLSIGVRDREIVIDRTCARCGCEYEWGVHVAVFAHRAGLTDQQLTSLTHGIYADPCWVEPRDRLLIRLVDQLHDHSDIDDELWDALCVEFTEPQLLDLTMLCGWYHAVSFTARTARVRFEPDAPTFQSIATQSRGARNG